MASCGSSSMVLYVHLLSMCTKHQHQPHLPALLLSCGRTGKTTLNPTRPHKQLVPCSCKKGRSHTPGATAATVEATPTCPGRAVCVQVTAARRSGTLVNSRCWHLEKRTHQILEVFPAPRNSARGNQPPALQEGRDKPRG